MKTRICLIFAALPAVTGLSQLLQVDQRADSYGNGDYSITTNTPIGQTFMPATNGVGFVELFIWEGGPATLRVNLRAAGIAGPLVAMSRPVRITASFKVPIRFDFGTNVPVVPEQSYCIEPILESGADCRFVFYHYGYPRGEGIVDGKPSTSIYSDMWFREGVVADFPRFTSLPAQALNRFSATLSGLPGQQIVIESSADGVTWLRLQTNVLTEGTLLFSDTNAIGWQRFYRAFYP
jgi:hypothetical protein